MADADTQGLAKITWINPETDERQDFTLAEGATASIGRLETNDICIREQHVSRQHAVINYREGIFMITDLGSANGVYVNDRRINEPFPLANGDVIRLYVPEFHFTALLTDADRQPTEHGTFIGAITNSGKGRLIITNGTQEGNSIPLMLRKVTVGRATSNSDWEIGLQDPSVSRPHARFELVDNNWILFDLGSANGTSVNGTPINEKGRALHDGDVISFGATMSLFRGG